MSEDSEDDRDVDDDTGGDKAVHKRKSSDETIIRSGYLWKKGERRKVRDESITCVFMLLCAGRSHVFIVTIYI